MNNSLLLMLLLCSTNAISASYKWVDEHNQTHYSEQPPANNKKAKLLPSTPNPSTNDSPASSAPAAPKTIAEQAAELKNKQLAKKEAADKAAKEQADAETRTSNCALAQQNLRTLESGVRIPIYDANGQRSYMEDDQRQQRIAKAQQQIGTYCK